MILNDIFMTNIMMTSITKINTGYILFDMILMILAISTVFITSNLQIKKKLYRIFESVLYKYDNTKSITFRSIEKNTSKRFKAIMFWIGKQNNPTVKKLLEIIDKKYSRISEDFEELDHNCYRVDQNTDFEIDKNIYGKINYGEKEITDRHGKTYNENIIYLNVFSKTLDLSEIQKWVDDRFKEYENHIRTKNSNDQMIVEIGWNSKDKELDINYNPWTSNATFSNRFFTNKEEILKKIEFFINNPEWYSKRGLPWTLGFLIWGKPGCGKTGFIKALMNLTKRHGISIKLNDKFNLSYLKTIIHDDEICDNLIIQQNKKIIILEDIDCMGDLIKDRDFKENENTKQTIEYSDSDFSDIDESLSTCNSKQKFKQNFKQNSKQNPKQKLSKNISKNNRNENNNLSYLLNILDGLQECPGRIIIMTTNKPEVLDSALVREGRIDYKIEFTNATTEDVINIVKFYWMEIVDETNLNKYLKLLDISINKLYSHASIVNMCRSSESIEETINKIMTKQIDKFKEN
jgi:hypothetical protein